jgi:hypothetical protein
MPTTGVADWLPWYPKRKKKIKIRNKYKRLSPKYLLKTLKHAHNRCGWLIALIPCFCGSVYRVQRGLRGSGRLVSAARARRRCWRGFCRLTRSRLVCYGRLLRDSIHFGQFDYCLACSSSSSSSHVPLMKINGDVLVSFGVPTKFLFGP